MTSPTIQPTSAPDDALDELDQTLRSFAKAYPENVFTPFSEEELETHSVIITRASGAMGRHMAQFTTQAADAIAALRARARELEELSYSGARSDSAIPYRDIVQKYLLERDTAQAALAERNADAERWQFVLHHGHYQGSCNGYSTFRQAVDAAIDQARGGAK